MSVSLFRVHLDHSDTCPFIAIYTPGVESVERTPRAKPTLKSASVDLKVSGRKAPVSTMVLSVTRRDRKAAVSSMVSVPCVIRIRFERVSQQVFANFSLKRNKSLLILHLTMISCNIVLNVISYISIGHGWLKTIRSYKDGILYKEDVLISILIMFSNDSC